jgi:hypothetical protein
MLPSLNVSVADVAARARDAVVVLNSGAQTIAREDAFYLGFVLFCFACGVLCIAGVAIGVPIGVACAVAERLRAKAPLAKEAEAEAPASEWIDHEDIDVGPVVDSALPSTKI